MPPPTYIMRFVTHGGEVYSSCHLEAASNEAALEKANFFEAPSIGNGFKLWQGLWLVACITRVGGQRKIRRVAIGHTPSSLPGRKAGEARVHQPTCRYSAQVKRSSSQHRRVMSDLLRHGGQVIDQGWNPVARCPVLRTEFCEAC
jgi:hypothetical protein